EIELSEIDGKSVAIIRIKEFPIKPVSYDWKACKGANLGLSA
ncbi:hypothetical protein HKBW3S44_01874, partial [Candidatus Hakubella thermalkaliphila]